MCADTTELTYETLLTDPLIQLVMHSDGVSQAQLAAVLRDAAAAVRGRSGPLPMRPRLSLVHSITPPPRTSTAAPAEIRATGT